jgi:hypothetical protein
MIAAVGITADRAATVTIDPAAIGTSLRTCQVTIGPEAIGRQRIVHRRIIVHRQLIVHRQPIGHRRPIGHRLADRAEETAFPTTGRYRRVPEVAVLLAAEEGLAGVRRRPASVVAPVAWEDLAAADPEAEDPGAGVVGGKKY